MSIVAAGGVKAERAAGGRGGLLDLLPSWVCIKVANRVATERLPDAESSSEVLLLVRELWGGGRWRGGVSLDEMTRQQAIKRVPAAVLAVAVALGIVADRCCPLSVSVWCLLAAATVVAGLIAVWRQDASGREGPALWPSDASTSERYRRCLRGQWVGWPRSGWPRGGTI